jgi:hypothetical protein
MRNIGERAWQRIVLVVAVCLLAVGGLVIALTPGSAESASLPPGFGSGPVTAGSAMTPAWAAARDFEPGVDPESSNDCQAGRTACLDAVVGEMEARFDELGCSHVAPFAFTYLQMTKEVGRSVADPDFFMDAPLTAQLDGVFAGLYFDAIDNWNAGRTDEVPGAWQIAFTAAEDGRTSAAADMFLGMNAHISRDLAYAVARILAANTELLDDPTDFLLVNEVIAAVQGPMLDDAAERFDPALAELASLVPADAGLDSVDLIALWRQQSFDLGRRLAAATTEPERAAVEAEIERNGVAAAVMILNADSSMPIDPDTFDRDAYCEVNR